jgi:hypothetical protein
MNGYSGYDQVKMVEKDKEKQHLFEIGVHMQIMICHLDYVMFLPHFKKW